LQGVTGCNTLLTLAQCNFQWLHDNDQKNATQQLQLASWTAAVHALIHGDFEASHLLTHLALHSPGDVSAAGFLAPTNPHELDVKPCGSGKLGCKQLTKQF